MNSITGLRKMWNLDFWVNCPFKLTAVIFMGILLSCDARLSADTCVSFILVAGCQMLGFRHTSDNFRARAERRNPVGLRPHLGRSTTLDERAVMFLLNVELLERESNICCSTCSKSRIYFFLSYDEDEAMLLLACWLKITCC